MSSICFVTTGDIKNIATAKRALGMANPLVALGWDVSILMEDTEENHHRVGMECCDKVKVYYFSHCTAWQEIKAKNKMIKKINPDYLYICAFVMRNTVGIGHQCRKLVEHSELQSGIPDMKGMRKIHAYLNEFFSILYSDALLNASKYLQNVFNEKAKWVFKGKMPMMYFPYAYSDGIMKLEKIDRNMSEFCRYKNRKVFVFLGSIVRGYGAFTMIEAMGHIKDKHPEALLLMLGRGGDYKKACEYVLSHHLQDCVELPGFVSEEEISTYFSLADYFVSPMNDTVQDWARCPSKLYMYLPYNKPIVTCKIGEPHNVLGTEGYYFEPSSSQSLAETIVTLLENGKSTINVDPLEHEWKYRTSEFDKWIKSCFSDKNS